jgi:hypothetical protein
MEVQIKNHYESYLSNMVLVKGGNVKLLSQEQQEYVNNRIKILWNYLKGNMNHNCFENKKQNT